MSGCIKKTTKLTGIPVAKNPLRVLSVVYAKTLRVLERMPESAAYHRHTETLVLERSKIVACGQDWKEVEQQIGCGQIEEVIWQAENELALARRMLDWRPWEPLMEEPPEGQWAWPPAQPVEQK